MSGLAIVVIILPVLLVLGGGYGYRGGYYSGPYYGYGLVGVVLLVLLILVLLGRL